MFSIINLITNKTSIILIRYNFEAFKNSSKKIIENNQDPSIVCHDLWFKMSKIILQQITCELLILQVT